MLTAVRLNRARVAGLAALCVASAADAQVCEEAAAHPFRTSVQIERQVDQNRYVHQADVVNHAPGDTVFEFDVRRTDFPVRLERWTVSFHTDVDFDHIRHLDIDGAWMHSFKSRIVGGVRHVTLAVPGARIEISRNDGPGSPRLAAFLALAAQTAEHRAVVAAVVDEFLPPDFPPLGCIADCTTDIQMCGYLPVCDPPYPPTACDCWESYECCMAEYLHWHLCGINCICMFCYGGFVDACCAYLGATQARIQLECETNLLACLSSHNLLPCAQN